jgi:nucleotide-binding universal stress UspA family protein
MATTLAKSGATTLAKGSPAARPQAPGALALRRILCPVDFSELTPLAMDRATQLASASGAEITALFVFPALPVPERERACEPAAPETGVRTTVAKDLERFLTRARNAGIPVRVALASGDPAREILAAAEAAGTDLIVMGTHGRSRFERWALGSVADAVLRNATCPVLTIAGARRDVHAPALRDGAGILCAVELNEASARTLECALSLARTTGQKVTLVHVLEDMSQYQAAALRARLDWQALQRELEDDARQRLAGAAAAAGGAECVADVLVAHGKPYREILRVAEERDASMIVMGVRGRAPLHLRLFGSNAEHVVCEASCPVLTVRGA